MRMLQIVIFIVGMLSWAALIITPRTHESQARMIEAQERELVALRKTVAIYKEADEKRRSMSWDTGVEMSTLSARGGRVQYVIKGKEVDREDFYRWLDEYMLNLNKELNK